MQNLILGNYEAVQIKEFAPLIHKPLHASAYWVHGTSPRFVWATWYFKGDVVNIGLATEAFWFFFYFLPEGNLST